MMDRSDSFYTLAEAFKKDIHGITGKIDDMSKNIRFEHLGKKQDRKLQEAEEKRRLEAEKRAARKREQTVRDPRKKVEIALENRRRFHEDEKSEIPMCTHQVTGRSGLPETFSLVDVNLIRSRIHQNASVSSLIEMQVRSEKLVEGSGKRKQPSMPHSVSEHSLGSLGSFSQDLNYEDRLQLASGKREMTVVVDALRRMTTMRGEVPTNVYLDTEVLHRILSGDVRGSDGHWNRVISSLKMQTNSWDDLLSSLTDKLEGGTGSVLLQQLARLRGRSFGQEDSILKRSCDKSDQSNWSGPPSPGRKSAAGRKSLQPRARSRTLANLLDGQAEVRPHKDVHQSWTMIRASTHLLQLHHRIRKKTRSVEIVKVVLRELGEWARIRGAISRAKKAVQTLQSACREFLTLKRQRCHRISKDWQLVEDEHLETFFHRYAEQLVKEQMKDLDRAKQRTQDFYKGLLAAVKGGEIAVNWKAFRIPAKERAQIISAYYVTQLRTKVRMRAGIYDATKEVMQVQRDLKGFLGAFGVQITPQEGLACCNIAPAQQEVYTAFWDVSQENMLQLIGMGAHLMAAKGVQSYEEHPSFKDLPGNPMHWEAPMDLKRVALEQGAQQLDRSIIRLVQRIMMRRYLAERQVTSVKSQVDGPTIEIRKEESHLYADLHASQHELSKKSKAKTNADLEDVFEAFTPRLRKIQEQQILEYRAFSKKCDTADDD